MKKMILFCLCLTVVLAACSSDDDSNTPQGAKEFPHDTEWVGVLDRAGYQFAPPAYLRFNADGKLVFYAPHFFIEEGNYSTADSVMGTVTSVTEIDDATVEVQTDIEHYGVITMTIKDRQKLTALSADGSKVLLTLEVYDTPIASLSGTIWSGPVMQNSGPTDGMLAYPDLSAILFNQLSTNYIRNGHFVQMTPQTPATSDLAEAGYEKRGAAVFMYGFDDSNYGYLYRYFGVLLPGNTKMMVHSGATGARLPYYTQTIAWYGPIGQTPIIERQ
jgi:hypothetical protein